MISVSVNVSPLLLAFFLTWYAKSPWSQNSIMIIKIPFSIKECLYETIFGWSNFLSSSASSLAPSCSFAFNYPRMTFFAIKYTSSSESYGAFFNLTKNAAPKFPLPIHFNSSNSSSYEMPSVAITFSIVDAFVLLPDLDNNSVMNSLCCVIFHDMIAEIP